jgi:hypothetical protein
MALVGMSPAAKGMNDEQRAQVVAAITDENDAVLRPYLDRTDLVFDLGANIAMARA